MNHNFVSFLPNFKHAKFKAFADNEPVSDITGGN